MAKKISYDATTKKETIIEVEEQANIFIKEIEINELKRQLAETDYQAIKYAEGQLSEEEYRPIKEQRQIWRDKINELEVL